MNRTDSGTAETAAVAAGEWADCNAARGCAPALVQVCA
jgi:hypothetical protein